MSTYVLKSIRDGKIQRKEWYSSLDVAFLMGVSKTTVARMIERRELCGIRLRTKRRPRRISHQALLTFVRRHPAFRYALDKLEGYDPNVDFAAVSEPPPPAHPRDLAGPWSPSRPRTAYRGRIPAADAYSVTEVSFVLGFSRKYVCDLLNSRALRGCRVPTSKAGVLSRWRWKIMHDALLVFLRQNPRYGYARDRIRGCESLDAAGQSPADLASKAQHQGPRRDGEIIPPGGPGWHGRPHQTLRGGFRPGPKDADGRQPQWSHADLAARAAARREPVSTVDATNSAETATTFPPDPGAG